MDSAEYARLVEATDRHWWFRSTRTLLEQIARADLPAMPPDAVLLDAAGGNGATGRWLTAIAPTVLVDLEPGILATVDDAGYLPVVADLNALPHPDDRFDVVLCVTALCHRLVPDPQRVVDELARVTRPGGLVLLMEPGVRRLRRGHDEVTHTARRFSRRDLRDLAERAGLDVVRSTGAYSFLVPLAAAQAVVDRGRSVSDVGRNQSGLAGLLGWLAGLERSLLRRVDLPAGLSVIAVGRKRPH